MKKFMLFLFIIVFSIANTIWLGEVKAGEQQWKSKFLESLEGESFREVYEGFNHVQGHRADPEIFKIAKDIWDKKIQVHPQWAWHILKKDLIKVRVAHLLYDNPFFESKEKMENYNKEIKIFLVNNLEKDDPMILVNSLSLLSFVDDPETVDNIKILSLKSEGVVFKSSIRSLSVMCNKKSENAINYIRGEIDDKAKIRIIENQEKLGKRLRSKGFCEK